MKKNNAAREAEGREHGFIAASQLLGNLGANGKVADWMRNDRPPGMTRTVHVPDFAGIAPPRYHIAPPH
jgi:hypothetical protein